MDGGMQEGEVSDTTPPAVPDLVHLEGDDIVIRITPDALTFATEHGCLCTFSVEKNDFRGVQITSLPRWREAIVRALTREEENGDTPVHLLLDAALEYALEQGEGGVWVEGITE